MSNSQPAIRHWQVMVRDPERASRFFAECFGWQADDGNALGYRGLRNAGVEGGIWPLLEGTPKVQLFVGVSDIDQTLAMVESNGGSIVIPRQVLPDGDEMAIVIDPEGISWGIMRIRP